MEEVKLVAIVLGGIVSGLIIVYTIARLVAVAWFKTKSEYNKEIDENGIPVQTPGRKDSGKASFAIG